MSGHSNPRPRHQWASVAALTSILPVAVCVSAIGTRPALPLPDVALSGQALPCAVTGRGAVAVRRSSGGAACAAVVGVGVSRVGGVAHVAEVQQPNSSVVDGYSAAWCCMN